MRRLLLALVLLVPLAARATLGLDTGFPATAHAAGNPATCQVTGVTITGAPRLIVMAVSIDGGNVSFPVTPSGASLSWTRISSAVWTGGSFVGKGGTEIWAAWANSTFSSQTFTFTAAASINGDCDIAVYSYSNAQDGSGSILNSFGTPCTAEDGTGGAATVACTLSSTTAGNAAVVVAQEGNDGTGLTANAQTSWDETFDDVSGSSLRIGRNSGALGGSKSMGSSRSVAFYSVTAVEVIAAPPAPPPARTGSRGRLASIPFQPGPLTVVGSGRYLLDSASKPWPLLARAGWGYGMELTPTQWARFLDDTKAHGYTAIEVMLTGRHPNFTGEPDDQAGNHPFLRRLDGTAYAGSLSYGVIGNEAADWTTPNPTYWSRVDQFVAAARDRGLVLMVFAAYNGYQCNTGEGWMPEMEANGAVKLYAYGQWIAQRYVGEPHLIWMLGGDCGTGVSAYTAGQKAVEEAFANGLRSITTRSTQVAAEWQDKSIGSDINAVSTVLNGYMTLQPSYSSGVTDDLWNESRAAYSASPTKPAFVQETKYIHRSPGDAPFRQHFWFSWLNSIAGYTQGNEDTWDFVSGTWDGASTGLNDPNEASAGILNWFIRGIQWWTLVPESLGSAPALCTSGCGTTDLNRVSGAINGAGTLAVVYSSAGAGSTFTFASTAMTGCGGGTYRARWFDPSYDQTGYQTDSGSPVSTSGTHVFTHPAAHADTYTDWVLVLDC